MAMKSSLSSKAYHPHPPPPRLIYQKKKKKTHKILTQYNSNAYQAQRFLFPSPGRKESSRKRDNSEGGNGCNLSFIFDPSGRLAYLWSAVVSCAFVYNLWVIIYRISIKEINRSSMAYWFLGDYLSDLIYLSDILFKFRTGFLDDGVLQVDLFKVRVRYMNSTLFYLDCLSLLPLDFLYLSFGFKSACRFFRLVKIYRFWDFLDHTERHTIWPNTIRTITLLHYILAIFHWNTCVTVLVTELTVDQQPYCPLHVQLDPQSDIKCGERERKDIEKKEEDEIKRDDFYFYLQSFYRSSIRLRSSSPPLLSISYSSISSSSTKFFPNSFFSSSSSFSSSFISSSLSLSSLISSNKQHQSENNHKTTKQTNQNFSKNHKVNHTSFSFSSSSSSSFSTSSFFSISSSSIFTSPSPSFSSPLSPLSRHCVSPCYSQSNKKLNLVFSIFQLVFGLLLFSSILGHVNFIVTNVSADRKDFQAKLDQVKNYMINNKTPRQVEIRVVRWMDYFWSSSCKGEGAVDEEVTLNLLPAKLRSEIALHVHLDTLKKVEIFQNCDYEFLKDLVLKMKLTLFSPGDFICRKGEIGREMYVVSRGRLEVINEKDSTVLAFLGPGSYFGELSILNTGSNKRTASVASVGFSDLFCLSKGDLWDVLKDYPQARVRLEAIAHKKMTFYKRSAVQKEREELFRNRSVPNIYNSSPTNF